MPEFRSTGGQTGRETEKAGMESGGRGKGECGRKVGVDEKNENFTKSVRITSAKVTDTYLIFLIL